LALLNWLSFGRFSFLALRDRLLFVWLYRLFPSVLNALTIVQPETVIRWHRTGFRLYWRWRSRNRGGRPRIPRENRRLIRELSLANRLWGAPRIHGELLKLGIEVAQSMVAKYMASSGRGRSQIWKTFLHNHVAGIGAMDCPYDASRSRSRKRGAVPQGKASVICRASQTCVGFCVTSNG
jgi:hypothetical protein